MPVQEEDRKPHHHHHDDDRMPHVHTYLTEVDVADEHQHILMGVSGPARERGRSHVHRIHGRTSFISEEGDCECGHWHTVDVMTGPAIDMPCGSHVHYFDGTTSENDDHCHSFSGVTGLGPCPAYETDEDDDCEEDTEEDDCECIEEEEDDCDPPVKMPKYKYKFGKRPEEE
jgi:hypothetical protein